MFSNDRTDGQITREGIKWAQGARNMINLQNQSASHADSHGNVGESDESKLNRACVY